MTKTYQNPIAKDGDFADPFVLRHNGVYYLYSTTPYISCWSSADLLEWKLEGDAIEKDTFPGLVPFAPEVVYSNGKFYMYTSPSGFGHYVLESENPAGPFRKISDNIQHAIDGTVFIDDDGRWYFYWAGDEGIWGCEMKSPTELGKPVLTGASMHGWTEGAFVCKHNGIYHMTYTGNHYLSKGYRINGAWSAHPLRGYQDVAYNPIVIHTQGEVVGLGHSCTVTGPDLVSSYLVYHNMNEDLTRHLNIDRQLWRENVTQVLGPTRTHQPAPAAADYSFPAGGRNELQWRALLGGWEYKKDVYCSNGDNFFVISEQKFNPGFTAEFNIINQKGSKDGTCGIVLGESRARFYSLVFDIATHSMQLWYSGRNDKELVKQSPLPADYIFEALHCVRVECRQDGLISVFVDNRLQIQETGIKLISARIGYFSSGREIGCGFTAITEAISEEASERILIPAGTSFYPVFGQGEFKRNQDGSILLKEGQEAVYRILIAAGMEYQFFVAGESGNDDAEAGLLIDNEKLGLFTGKQGLQSYRAELSEGIHVLKVCGSGKELTIKKICFIQREDGEENQELPLPMKVGRYEKRIFGKADWSDYTVTAAIIPELTGEEGNAGVLLRVTEPSEGGEGDDTVLGIHFFIGYSVSFTKKELVVARHSYDSRILARRPFTLEPGRCYELRAELRGAEISVYVDQSEAPQIVVADTEPIMYGCPGVWAKDSLLAVERFGISV